MHKISFCEALNEAMYQEMERDSSVFVYGIGVPDHKKIFGSTERLLEDFGPMRCFDTPVAEESMTGFGLGAAIGGLRPIHIHIRVDFLLLAMNQLVNMVSNIHYVSGGQIKVPMVIRAVIGRGWGQGCQHSKSLQGMFAHFPGLKVIMPTTPADAKGLLTSAIRDDNLVLCLEHRWLYWQEDDVPVEPYVIPIGQPNRLREGKDVTIVATSWMNIEAKKAADILSREHKIEVDLIDPRTISKCDYSLIFESVRKTGHCIVADNDWDYCGYSAELSSAIHHECFFELDLPVERIGFAHCPCPTGRHLENKFYSNAITIIRSVEEMFGLVGLDLSNEDFYSHERRFKGPF